MQRQIAEAVKAYMVKLAIADKFPLDLNELDTGAIEKVVAKAITKFENDNPTCAGFNYEDVMERAAENDISLSIEEAKDVVRYMIRKAEIPISWETVDYFVDRFIEEKV